MNALDRAIAFLSPTWGLERMAARATMDQINAVTGGKGGYSAGKINRLNSLHRTGPVKEHQIPADQITTLREKSWFAYRNNPHARKAVRTLESKVIGQEMLPESHANHEDGQPHVEFRQRCSDLWKASRCCMDFRGRPGQGGMTMGGLQRMGLRMTMLSGEVLHRMVPMRGDTSSPTQLALQLIDATRLADDVPPFMLLQGEQFYRGIALTPQGQRTAYFINAFRPGDALPAFREPKRRPAAEIGHLFVEEDLDQLRGVPWLASVLMQMQGTEDLQHNVLTSSAMAACIVLGYRKATGAQRFGLNESTESGGTSDLVDQAGNAITKIQPGMFINLGKDGALEGFSPNQPNLNSEAFIQHMLRGTAAGISGVKSSSLTGDYRGASFSAEKASDNDTWPEIHVLQDWFSTSFCQPIWESMVSAAVLTGWFDGIITADEYMSEPSRFTVAKWQGPVAQSINPEKDIEAAAKRMQHLLSSPQMECAKTNVDWRAVLNDVADFYATAEKKGIPQEVVNNMLSVDTQDSLAVQAAAAGGEPDEDFENDEEDADAEAVTADA